MPQMFQTHTQNVSGGDKVYTHFYAVIDRVFEYAEKDRRINASKQTLHYSRSETVTLPNRAVNHTPFAPVGRFIVAIFS